MGEGDEFLAQTIDWLGCAESLPAYSTTRQSSQIVGGRRHAEKREGGFRCCWSSEESLAISFQAALGGEGQKPGSLPR